MTPAAGTATNGAAPVQAGAGTAYSRLLTGITGPDVVRALAASELPGLAAEIRRFLIDKVTAVGGHLGPNLGAVELTIALHRVFDSPRDAIVFDTGHQAYVHKILTGRAGDFDTLRQRGGLSGYPSRNESRHDVVESSHASTALAWADGIAKAWHLSGELQHPGETSRPARPAGRRVVAVVGDGALTGGMCWEAMNNLGGAPERPVVVLLNDNTRSYSPTVGALAGHLADLRQSAAHATGTSKPAQTAGGNLFEALGLSYLGPVDGHDIAAVEAALRRADSLRRPVVVHVVTVKGRGYPPAETNLEDCLHSCGVVDAATGSSSVAGRATWTQVFASEITQIGAERPDVVAVTAAMLHPAGLGQFAARFPARVFDVGIAEQHAVTSAAGLATAGLHPVVAIYATFVNRAFDQIMMEVALHRLPVTFVLDRAGITGPDGPSHHGMWDLSMLCSVPGLRIAAPRDPARLRELLREAVETGDGPTVVRYPKATAGPDLTAVARMDGIDILHRGHRLPMDVLLIATGVMAEPCVQAAVALNAQGIGVTVIDPRWVLPVNPAIAHLAARHRLAITVEDGTTTGGIGTAITQACTAAGVHTPVHNAGLPAAFLPHADRASILTEHRLDAAGIAGIAIELAEAPRQAGPPDTHIPQVVRYG